MKKIIPTQYERFQKINQRLQAWGGKPVSKLDLMNYCGAKERTLKEDIAMMRELYQAPIKYDYKIKGFYYSQPFDLEMRVHLTKSELAALDAAVQTLRQFSHLEPFKELNSAVTKLDQAVKYRFQRPKEENNYIQFEYVPVIPGGELIAPLLDVMRGRQWVTFRHRKFEANVSNTYHLFPYLIKEHRNRWYVVGWEKTRRHIRAFGLERIEESSLIAFESDTEAPVFDSKAYFEKALGIAIYDQEPVEEVILSFTPFQANYFKTQPFFPYHPEDVICDNDTEFRVKLHLIINKEIVYELARLGAEVWVIAPPKLAQQVYEYHLAALQRYQP